MKKLILFLFVLVGFTFAQTNSITYTNGKNTPVKNESGSAVFECTFTLDSLAGLASQVFTLPNDAIYNFDTTGSASSTAPSIVYPLLQFKPVYFEKYAVSTYGTPKLDIFLQKVARDTATIDTVAFQNTGETDSTGNMYLNGKQPTKFRVFFRCLNADINSGYLKIVFPKISAWKP